MLKRTPLKRKPSSIKRVSEKRKAEKAQSISDSDKMWQMFNEIWNVRPHLCNVCGSHLGNIPKSYHFDHLLEKSKYPEFKYDKDNILLVCIDCHACKTNGFPKPKHSEAIKQFYDTHKIY